MGTQSIVPVQQQGLSKEQLRQPGSAKSLQTLLEQYKGQFAMALPKHMTAERMIRVALTAFNTTPELAKCSLLSIAASVVQASILGLEPNSVLGEAYLIPFKGQCVLVPGYKGLLKLVRNSGELVMVNAQTVHQNDEFDFEDGLDPYLRHKRATGERGPAIAYWAGALLKGGGKQFVYMTRSEAFEHGKKYSKAFSSAKSVWQTDFDQAALKTCIRKLCKYLPQSVESQIAVGLDERAEAGMTQRFSVDVPIDLHPVVEDEGNGESISSGIGQPRRLSEGNHDAALDRFFALEKQYGDRFWVVMGAMGQESIEAIPANARDSAYELLVKQLTDPAPLAQE